MASFDVAQDEALLFMPSKNHLILSGAKRRRRTLHPSAARRRVPTVGRETEKRIVA
jgi:hypothetical protein